MAAATAYCTSNTAFHQHSLTTTRSQFSPVPRRTTLSPSTSYSPTASISHIEQPSIIKTIKSDENNNEHQIDDETISSINDILYITSDNDDLDSADDGDQIMDDAIDEEQFLALVGLRSKIKKPVVKNLTLLPLTKRLACPVCLLPLPKYSERVRQALYMRLPFLKFLSITYDIDSFCSTDENTRAQSLLPRSMAQTRALSTLNKSPKKKKSPKTEFISVATNTFRNNTSKTTTNQYVSSILRCNVVLDRLEQSTIDQIMENSIEDDNKTPATISTSDQSLNKTFPEPCRSLTNETMTTEKTIVKRKSIETEISTPKRFKSVDNDSANTNDNNTKNDLPSSAYQRIYLKCFVCSKRQYVNAQTTNSDVLHSHWLEHDGDLSLNIYDSEIDSILTRVVEFFNLPKHHMLEGKIKTVFIFNSKEIRCTSTTNLSSNDSFIVID